MSQFKQNSYLLFNFEQRTPPTEKDVTTATNDVEPLLTNNLPRKNSRKSIFICTFHRTVFTKFSFFFFSFSSFICTFAPKWTESELDEDSNDEDPNPHSPQSGVDDGFFVGTRPAINGDTPEKEIPRDGTVNHDRPPSQGDHHGNFPFAPGFNPTVVSDITSLVGVVALIRLELKFINNHHSNYFFQILDGNGNPQVIPDINVYQQKKNLGLNLIQFMNHYSKTN